MYYDRRVNAELVKTLSPGKALSWLVDHVASAEGQSCHAHIQFRRDRNSARRLGSVQLYWGRTSPLEFQFQRGGRVRLHAAASYRNQSIALFSCAVPLSQLAGLETELRDHLDRAAKLLRGNPRRRALLSGEAVYHSGLMRRYSLEWRAGDPFLMADSEIRVGYGSKLERDAAREKIRKALGLGKYVPTKLDALGVLPTGDVVLVEVKGTKETIRKAAIQVAAHVTVMSRLRAEGTLPDAVNALLIQKRDAGLIPNGHPTVRTSPDIVPCIAAPDCRTDWEQRWRADLSSVDDRVSRHLHGLRLACLAQEGHVVGAKA